MLSGSARYSLDLTLQADRAGYERIRYATSQTLTLGPMRREADSECGACSWIGKMTLQDLGNLGEVVGAIATVATLIYLAIQLRHNSVSIQATAELEASRQLAQFVGRISADSNMKRIYDLIANEAELSPEDERDYSWFLAECFHMTEGVFIQFRKGRLSVDIWNEYEVLMVGFLESETARRWWNGVAPPFSDSFRSYMEDCRKAGGGWRPDVIGRYERSSTDAA